MRDIFGDEAVLFQKMEKAARKIFQRFGFEELRTPILEEKELFSRALGTETDVVQKEMYEFLDRSQTHVALRPEGTAGVVRAYLENNFDKNEGFCKFYYMGPMFRSERPQAGRLRQFHQIGAEQLGTDSPYADAETIHALTAFLDEVGVADYQVKLNNLGTFEERRYFKEKLKEYFEPRKNELCEDCKNRLQKNVFRILDCKVDSCRKIIIQSPKIGTFLTTDSATHFKAVLTALTDMEIKYVGDSYMVRGLDYYTKTVFEITHPKLGAQDALAAGGRYDTLIESFGGAGAGAVGFAIGMERLAMCLNVDKEISGRKEGSFFIVTLGESAFGAGFKMMSELRTKGVNVSMDLSPKSMKSQMRLADKMKSRFTLILGDNELQKGEFVLKNMEQGTQETHPMADAVKILSGKK
jgi:histidyl-tRNA synthetase